MVLGTGVPESGLADVGRNDVGLAGGGLVGDRILVVGFAEAVVVKEGVLLQSLLSEGLPEAGLA